ncbi:MAG: CBS domain-containing protein [Chitinophagaceae bacterium]
MDDQKLKGIISERDYARKIILKGKSSRESLVKEIMTEKVITVLPEDDIEKCMQLMSGRKIRHLPVMKDDKVLGIVSITDVVTGIIEMQKNTIAQLESYISN